MEGACNHVSDAIPKHFTGHQEKVNFPEQLEKQLLFLRSSCALFDRGEKNEGIRIAQCLRVIFHDSPKSILTHLNANNINLLTSIEPNPSIEDAIFFDGAMKYGFGQPGPEFDDTDWPQIPFKDWWEQIVFVIRKEKIRRCDLVLDAANKDGGSHVDEKLRPRYQDLISNFWQNSDGPIQDNNLRGLRLLGFEVLHSPELLIFANL